MYLVKFSNMEVSEFYAVDFDDLMMLLVDYVGGNSKKDLFKKAIVGFKDDLNKEYSYIEVFNLIFRYSCEEIEKIYEVKGSYE